MTRVIIKMTRIIQFLPEYGCLLTRDSSPDSESSIHYFLGPLVKRRVVYVCQWWENKPTSVIKVKRSDVWKIQNPPILDCDCKFFFSDWRIVLVGLDCQSNQIQSSHVEVKSSRSQNGLHGLESIKLWHFHFVPVFFMTHVRSLKKKNLQKLLQFHQIAI